MNLLHQELLRQAIDSAKEGNREKALELVGEVLEEDENNVQAWFLAARLATDDAEKRLALTTLLELNPNHEKGLALLAKLDAQKASTADELIPGVSRKHVMMAGGGIFVVFVIMMIIFMLVRSGNASREQEQFDALTLAFAQQTAVIVTEAARQAALATDQIRTAELLTATQWAITSPTPSPTFTSVAPTLPPEKTATPVPTENIIEAFPPPVGVTGVISGWGGRDTLNIDALPILLYTLTGGEDLPVPQEIGSSFARLPALSPDGKQIVFENFNRTRNQTDVLIVDLEGENVLGTNLDTAPTLGRFIESWQPNLSTDGTQVVYIGESLDTNTTEIYLTTLIGEGGSTTVRLTNDDANYSYPALSPDGSTVVAVRDNPTNEEFPGPDLYLISTTGPDIRPLTLNNTELIETMPRFSPDGGIVLYSARTPDSENHNIYISLAANRDSPATLVVGDMGDAIHPIYSPDGQHIAFASNRTGAYDIYIFNMGNFSMYQLTNSPEEDYPAHWVIVTEAANEG